MEHGHWHTHDAAAGMTASDVWTIVIAGLALVVAALTLIWQWRRSVYERPIVVVQGDTLGSHIGSGRFRFTLTATVTNVGERPVTLSAVEFEADLDPLDPLRYSPQPKDEGPAFPFRLEPYDSRQWKVSSYGLRVHRDRFVTPIATVVRRPTWRDKASTVEIQGDTIQLFGSGPDTRRWNEFDLKRRDKKTLREFERFEKIIGRSLTDEEKRRGRFAIQIVDDDAESDETANS